MRYAVLVGILLIAAPLLLRLNSPEPFGDAASYGALRESQLNEYDSLYAKPHNANASDLLFRYIPPQLALILLAVIALFMLSIYYDSEVFLLLLATSPVFIDIYTKVGEAALGITTITIGVLLISKRQYWAVLLIPFCFSLSFSLGILASLVFISVALVERMPFVALGTSFFALISGVIVALTATTIDMGFHLPQQGQLLNTITTTNGITVFLVVLGVTGFLVQYGAVERKLELFLLLLIIPFAVFFEQGTIVIVAMLAYFGSKAWHFLVERKWQFEEIRTLTLALIFCGILFTSIVAVRNHAAVDEQRVEVTKFITAAYPPGTPVAADPDLAPILAYRGYPSDMPELPSDPSFITSTLRADGYELIVTREEEPPYGHYPIVYRAERGYTVYGVPRYD